MTGDLFPATNYLTELKRRLTVKNFMLSKSILSLMLGVSAFVAPVSVMALDQQEECSKEILLAYFPQIFVNETLERFKVPKDQWDAINKELGAKDKDVIKTVEAKASKMNPNPLKDPQQRQVAVKIFRETLFDSFASVMRTHGVNDDKQIQAMLDDIQQQKAKRFAKCMESAQKTQPQQGGAPVSQVQPVSAQSQDSADNDD